MWLFSSTYVVVAIHLFLMTRYSKEANTNNTLLFYKREKDVGLIEREFHNEMKDNSNEQEMLRHNDLYWIQEEILSSKEYTSSSFSEQKQPQILLQAFFILSGGLEISSSFEIVDAFF